MLATDVRCGPPDGEKKEKVFADPYHFHFQTAIPCECRFLLAKLLEKIITISIGSRPSI